MTTEQRPGIGTFTVDFTGIGPTPRPVGKCPGCGGVLAGWLQWGNHPVVSCQNAAHPYLRGEALAHTEAGDADRDGADDGQARMFAAPVPSPAPAAAPERPANARTWAWGAVEAVPITTTKGEIWQTVAQCPAHGGAHWYCRNPEPEPDQNLWQHAIRQGGICTMRELSP